jgi:hypothetical protein
MSFIGLQKDHHSLVKFHSERDEGFDLVLQQLLPMSQEAAAGIQRRWDNRRSQCTRILL